MATTLERFYYGYARPSDRFCRSKRTDLKTIPVSQRWPQEEVERRALGLSISGRKRAISAAMIACAARPAPSSHLMEMPSPSSGSAPQYTPSAPVLTNTREPKSCMISVQNRPVPATCQGLLRAGVAQSRGGPGTLGRHLVAGCELGEGHARALQRDRPGRHRATVDGAAVFAQHFAASNLPVSAARAAAPDGRASNSSCGRSP